jgi:hypothetical protein
VEGEMLGLRQTGIKHNTRPKGLAQLVSELYSILAALEWRDSSEEGFPHASREVILKLNTKLSFCCENATENRPLRTTKSTAELWQQA